MSAPKVAWNRVLVAAASQDAVKLLPPAAEIRVGHSLVERPPRPDSF